ncbi:MAG: type IV secretion system DNA-binding domain-containing protein [Patescibacteria group bacterium]|nr:type IV secretion system DNA-binding domain-containing protein [Patescibacteria group bacterium]
MNYGIDYTNIFPASSINSAIDWSLIVFYAAIAVVFLIIVLIALRILRGYFARNQYLTQTVFMVRLPKEKPGEENKEPTVQDLREQIAVGEAIFNSIGGSRAQRGLKAWLFGRADHFSFEIVATDKKIYFYVVTPAEMARYIEQQIHANFPDALVEEVPDYNIFNPGAKVFASVIKTKKSFVFPIRTYNKMEIDPMNSLVNVMSKLEKDESMALQVLVRSAKSSWHRKISSVVREVNRGKKVGEAVGNGAFNKTMAFLGSVAKEAKPKSEREKEAKEPKKLSAMEEEMLKNMEDKNSKAGLDVNIRIVVSTKNEHNGKAYLLNMANAFAEYNYYEYGNIFQQKNYQFNSGVIHDFIYRRFDEGIGFLLNTEELDSIYHFPLKNLETPNIAWLTARQAPAPSNIPSEGIVLGKNVYRGVDKEIRIKRADRRRHCYVIGKSGTGKSKFIASLAIQDILNGEGVCVMDPHGDLIEDIMKRIPPERAEDVILFSPADIERPMGLNLIEFDERYPEQKTFVINELIKIFDKLYDLKTTGGPMFEQYMRNALLLIMAHTESGSTLMEVPRVLSDPDFRQIKLKNCSDITVVDFWQKQAEKAGGEAALANIVPYITSKLTQFVSNDTMRPIIGQQKSSFNLRDVMDKQKILLVDLSKGKIGDMNAYLLGLIIVGKILMAALSRADMPDTARKDFYLYIDEFQNFTTDSINTILSEARKYGLNLIIAHQYLGQLGKEGEAIRSAVFGNVGSWFTFKIGSEDAEVLAKEYSPVFNEYDLINIEAYTAYVKLLIDNTASRPFSMKTIWPPAGLERPEIVDKIKTLSRLKYGRDRALIEAEINKRLTLF